MQDDDEDPCPNGQHCCCCGPGEACCDCGEIMPMTDIQRTLDWAKRFRQAAADMPDYPPDSIDPILWKAQREAYISQAEDLERQAEHAEEPPP